MKRHPDRDSRQCSARRVRFAEQVVYDRQPEEGTQQSAEKPFYHPHVRQGFLGLDQHKLFVVSEMPGPKLDIFADGKQGFVEGGGGVGGAGRPKNRKRWALSSETHQQSDEEAVWLSAQYARGFSSMWFTGYVKEAHELDKTHHDLHPRHNIFNHKSFSPMKK